MYGYGNSQDNSRKNNPENSPKNTLKNNPKNSPENSPNNSNSSENNSKNTMIINIKDNVMVKVKRILLAAIVSLICFLAVGCTDIDGDLMKEKEVLKAVKEQVPSERYKFIKVEHHDELRPKEDIYYFESKDRDMSFQAVSTLVPIGLDASTIGYSKHVNPGYAEGVHNLYIGDMEKVLEVIPKNDKGQYCFTSYTELEKVLGIIAEADSIYTAEKKFNTEKWMEENPAKKVLLHFNYKDENGESKSRFTFTISLNGLNTYESLHDLYTYLYVKRVMDEDFSDPTIPEDAYKLIHAGKLENICVDWSNISETAFVDDKANNLTNGSRDRNGNDPYSAHYYYQWGTYVVVLNVGLASEEYAPKLMEVYFDTLGVGYEIRYGKGSVKWIYGGDEWAIEAKQDKNHDSTSCEFYKNGKKQEIKYLTYNDAMSPVHATYLVGISVDDFADIFDLEYDINEQESTIKFYSNEIYK